jgi:hypothetical protein
LPFHSPEVYSIDDLWIAMTQSVPLPEVRFAYK